MVRVVAISKLEWGYLRIRWLQKWTNVPPFNVGGSQKSVRVCSQLAVLVAVVVVAAVFVLFFGGVRSHRSTICTFVEVGGLCRFN